MANPEFKNPSSSSSTLRDTKQMGEKILNEASPRVRETIDQVSDVANDLYSKASDWLDQGNNRNYGFIALAATAGVIGFLVGRGFQASRTSKDEI